MDKSHSLFVVKNQQRFGDRKGRCNDCKPLTMWPTSTGLGEPLARLGVDCRDSGLDKELASPLAGTHPVREAESAKHASGPQPRQDRPRTNNIQMVGRRASVQGLGLILLPHGFIKIL